MKRKICFVLLTAALFLGGCGSQGEIKDGFYTAEMSGYSHGWKEYVCIMVKNNKIVYTEFNAKDASGYIKAWDNAYMQNMEPVSGTYPNEYTRYYAAELIEKQTSSGIDTLTGATTSGNNFIQLTAAAIEQAKKGDADTVVVEMSGE
ncbi:MAG: FMN-binding protein [Lachnospiraceae bacterium]|nr:FMN-binding protein [Lachnospiraceae bacterium]MDE7330730.1 FMN-binding protein [Lachnospiraceae bacterium]